MTTALSVRSWSYRSCAATTRRRNRGTRRQADADELRRERAEHERLKEKFEEPPCKT